METPIRRGDVEIGAKPGKPTNKQRRVAPATLQIVTGTALAPIPLLSPLILNPDPLPNCLDGRREAAGEVEGENKYVGLQYGGRWHPAMPLVSALEPASLVPYFRSQCKLAHSDSSVHYDFV